MKITKLAFFAVAYQKVLLDLVGRPDSGVTMLGFLGPGF